MITYIVVLGAVGSSMFVASLKNLRRGRMMTKAHRPASRAGILKRLPFQVNYQRSNVRHSVLAPFSLAIVVGILASIMGVGGAFMMVPMMVYLLGMPAHVAVGTSLFQTLFTCAGVTYMQSTANHTVDLVLALLLAAGSTIGAQIGARMTRFLRGRPTPDHSRYIGAGGGREDADRCPGHTYESADTRRSCQPATSPAPGIGPTIRSSDECVNGVVRWIVPGAGRCCLHGGRREAAIRWCWWRIAAGSRVGGPGGPTSTTTATCTSPC